MCIYGGCSRCQHERAEQRQRDRERQASRPRHQVLPGGDIIEISTGRVILTIPMENLLPDEAVRISEVVLAALDGSAKGVASEGGGL